jgi:hypothetical protein
MSIFSYWLLCTHWWRVITFRSWLKWVPDATFGTPWASFKKSANRMRVHPFSHSHWLNYWYYYNPKYSISKSDFRSEQFWSLQTSLTAAWCILEIAWASRTHTFSLRCPKLSEFQIRKEHPNYTKYQISLYSEKDWISQLNVKLILCPLLYEVTA